ncbi:MAG: hypothetical protein QF412_09950, partial [Planctomycetota bacterium]|nr:hypothetical protein [Planctomycetota bacterium]
MRIGFLLLLLVLARQLTAQTPTPQFLPADQLVRPGEAMTWTLSGPPFAPFSVLIDALSGSMPTPHGVFGLAGSPALSVPIDGLGIATILNVPGSPSGV